MIWFQFIQILSKILTFCLSLMEPLPRTAIFVIVSSWSQLSLTITRSQKSQAALQLYFQHCLLVNYSGWVWVFKCLSYKARCKAVVVQLKPKDCMSIKIQAWASFFHLKSLHRIPFWPEKLAHKVELGGWHNNKKKANNNNDHKDNADNK